MTPARFKELRLHLGLRKYQLADLLGCSRNTVGDIEKGKTDVSLLMRNALSNVLNGHPPAS